MKEKISILIINPNSTQAMTDGLVPLVDRLLLGNITASYLTGPPNSPASINDILTSKQSAEACLPLLIPLLDSYSGFLVACYSAHPLIPQLRAHTKKPVVGIFEASIWHALSLGGGFGIVTTGVVWETLLIDAVAELLGCRDKCKGVKSTELNADEFHTVGHEAVGKIRCAVRELVVDGEVGVVCLGCAGMVGLEEVVMDAAKEMGRDIRVVDGVKAGVGVLVGMLGRGYEC